MRIIALEGLDGAGKTTVLEALKASPRLSSCVFAGEFHSELGKLLKDNKSWLADPFIKLYAFAADRAITYADLSKKYPPGTPVVWDRYLYSAMAYREAERRLGRSRFGFEEAEAVNRYFPAATAIIYMRIPVREAVGRREGDVDLLEKVAECYEELLNANAVPYRVVDATRPPDQVAADVEGAIKDALAKA